MRIITYLGGFYQVFRLEILDENRLAVGRIGIAECLFVKDGFALKLDDRDKIDLFVDDLFDLVFKFDQICGGNIAAKDTLLVMFEVFFTTFENLGDSVFAGVAFAIGDIVKDKSVVVVKISLAQHFSFIEKG